MGKYYINISWGIAQYTLYKEVFIVFSNPVQTCILKFLPFQLRNTLNIEYFILRHVGQPFGNRILNNSWAVGLT